MKSSFNKMELICFFLASLLGVLFHFVYEWTGENPVIGLFVPINESTWEHLKLIFFPILIVSVVEYFVLHAQHENYICIKFLSTLLGMALTVVLFYTYTGVYGKNSEVLNILIYFVSIAASYWYSYRKLKKHAPCGVSSSLCYFGFVLMTLLFALFTVFPPHINLFIPPIP